MSKMANRRKPEEAVTILLGWLKKAMAQTNQSNTKNPNAAQFQKMEQTLDGMKDLLPKLKQWEESFMKELSALEKDISDAIEDGKQLEKINQRLTLLHENVKNFGTPKIPIRPVPESGSMSLEEPVSEARKMSEDWLRLKVEENVLGSSAMANLQASYDVLDLHLKLCLLCFSIFPDNSIIKKRPLINWWIAEGFIKSQKKNADKEGSEKTANEKDSIAQSSRHDVNTKTEKIDDDDEKEGSISKVQQKIVDEEVSTTKTTEKGADEEGKTTQKEKTGSEVGEEKFQELIRLGFIQPMYNKKRPSVNSCKMHPWIRRMLISIAKKADFFDFDSTNSLAVDSPTSRRACLYSGSSSNQKEENLIILFNVSEQYLNLKAEWFSKLKKLVVLQLGRWETSAARHLEVENDEFLNNFAAQKQLKYLSLHGVSRITQLTSSLLQLLNLEILELRACHNLEKLPPDITQLKKLTHLDLSECYLLEGMPKGLDKLASLQVLKGFLIGKPWNTECKFANLVPLKKLRKLSICIGRDATVEELDLDQLKDIVALRILSITWENLDFKNEAQQSSTTANPAMRKGFKALQNKGEQSSRPENSIMEMSKPSKIKGDQSTAGEASSPSKDTAKLKKKEKFDLRYLPCFGAKGVPFLESENKSEQSSKAENMNIEEANEVGNLKRKISFPPELEKLDLWCLPCWPDKLNPTKLSNLKRLYIRGGKLGSFPKFGNQWTVEILRLKFLKSLKFEREHMRGDFPKLKYLEKVECDGKDLEWTQADEEII